MNWLIFTAAVLCFAQAVSFLVDTYTNARSVTPLAYAAAGLVLLANV